MILVLALLGMSACVSTRGWDGGEYDCPVLVVDNQHFSDVVLTLESPRRRIGMAGGLRETSFRVCRPRDARAVIEARAIGGAFHITLRSAAGSRMLEGSTWSAVITPTTRGSFLIGDDG